MRALIGAIIAAGALIGLGLTNLGLGIRYQLLTNQGQPIYDMKFKDVDNPLQFGVIFLTIMAMIGLGIAFVGLMYHHERRFREAQLAGTDTRAVP
jgi:cell division protein FtsX